MYNVPNKYLKESSGNASNTLNCTVGINIHVIMWSYMYWLNCILSTLTEVELHQWYFFFFFQWPLYEISLKLDLLSASILMKLKCVWQKERYIWIQKFHACYRPSVIPLLLCAFVFHEMRTYLSHFRKRSSLAKKKTIKICSH